MKLETKRLILRDLSKRDITSIQKNGNGKEINLFTWYIPYPFTKKEAEKLVNKIIKGSKVKNRINYELGIQLKENDKVIGTVNIYDISDKNKKAKLGYWIGKNYRRKGFASEAVVKIIKFAFGKLKLNKICAKSLIINYASNKLLKKFRFRKVGLLKEDQIINGKRYDCYSWELLKKNFI